MNVLGSVGIVPKVRPLIRIKFQAWSRWSPRCQRRTQFQEIVQNPSAVPPPFEIRSKADLVRRLDQLRVHWRQIFVEHGSEGIQTTTAPLGVSDYIRIKCLPICRNYIMKRNWLGKTKTKTSYFKQNLSVLMKFLVIEQNEKFLGSSTNYWKQIMKFWNLKIWNFLVFGIAAVQNCWMYWIRIRLGADWVGWKMRRNIR